MGFSILESKQCSILLYLYIYVHLILRNTISKLVQRNFWFSAFCTQFGFEGWVDWFQWRKVPIIRLNRILGSFAQFAQIRWERDLSWLSAIGAAHCFQWRVDRIVQKKRRSVFRAVRCVQCVQQLIQPTTRSNCPKSEDNWSHLIFTQLAALHSVLLLCPAFPTPVEIVRGIGTLCNCDVLSSIWSNLEFLLHTLMSDGYINNFWRSSSPPQSSMIHQHHHHHHRHHYHHSSSSSPVGAPVSIQSHPPAACLDLEILAFQRIETFWYIWMLISAFASYGFISSSDFGKPPTRPI